LLHECIQFAREYSLTFNTSKSKYVLFKSGAYCKSKINFDGKILECSEQELHLGNLVGNNVNGDRISKATADFYRRFNVLHSSFKSIDTTIKYSLFKTYCMSLYGLQLWDFSSIECQSFYTAWRKCVRLLFGVSNRTHCHLLPYMCNDLPVDVQLHTRFLKFFHTAVNSDNMYTKLCAKLAREGSNSSVSKSLTFITQQYRIVKSKLEFMQWSTVANYLQPQRNEMYQAVSGAIIDFLMMKSHYSTPKNSNAELEEIILHLCTS